VRRRQLTDDGNVEITGRDLREREIREGLFTPGCIKAKQLYNRFKSSVPVYFGASVDHGERTRD
jgi:hypothetical protein